MTPAMIFSTFSSLYATKPTLHRSWEEFVDQLREVRVVMDKHKVPLYCPSIFIGSRKKANVIESHFGAADIDSAPPDVVVDLIEELDEMNLHFIVHSTHSHHAGLEENPEKFKCRILFPLTRPVQVEEFDLFWAGLNGLCNGLLDPSCKDPSRMYFYPSCPPGAAEQDAFVSVFNEEGGLELDVDVLNEDTLANGYKSRESFVSEFDPERLKSIGTDLRCQRAQEHIDERFPGVEEGGRNGTCYRVAQTCGDFGLSKDQAEPFVLQFAAKCDPPLPEHEAVQVLESAYKGKRALPFGWRLLDLSKTDAVVPQDLKDLAKKLAKKTGRRDGEDGRILRQLLDGEPVGANAEFIYDRVARCLASAFKSADGHGLASILEKSIEATRKGGERDITTTWFAERVQHYQDQRTNETTQENLERIREKRNRIQDAFRSVGIPDRTTPYTEQELEEYAEEAGFEDKTEFKRRWILRFRRSFFFFVGGSYVERHQDDAHNSAPGLLLPADLRLTKTTNQGADVQLSLSELVDTYGTVIDHLVSSMVEQKTHYKPENKTLVRATCPFRKLEPKFSPYVDEWVQHLANFQEPVIERLNDWLAAVPVLDRPCCSLFIYGAPSAGKELMASSLARLWTTDGPTDLQSLAGNFNEELMCCPLVFGDEFVPTDFQGEPRLDLLRKIITERSRTFRAKHVSDTKLLGSIRLLLAANNPDLFVGKYANLTNNDIRAIAERFLCVRAPNSAVEYLQDLRDTREAHDSDVQAMFGGDAIAQHVWWLHHNRDLPEHQRLVVAGFEDSELTLRLMVGSGMRATICGWISNYIARTAQKDDLGNKVGEFVSKKGQPTIQPRSPQAPQGRLLVTSKIIHERWEQYTPDKNTPAPRINTIQRALGGCTRKTSQRNPETGRVEAVRVVDLSRVKFWAASTGHANLEQFDVNCRKLGIDAPFVDPQLFEGDD